MDYKETVVILDFGSQYTQLIARRVRECGVYCEIFPYNIDVSVLRQKYPKGLILKDRPSYPLMKGLTLKDRPSYPLMKGLTLKGRLSYPLMKGLILSGGPASLTSKQSPVCNPGIFNLGVPILGICYGMQLEGRFLGGQIAGSKKREYGFAQLNQKKGNALFRDMPLKFPVWMSHGDKVTMLPDGFKVIASTSNSHIAAMGNEEKKIYGVQFHPEVAHTPLGKKIFENFLYRICGCSKSWNMRSFIKQAIGEIRGEVGDEKVLCALSGGVDSSTLSVLLHKAIGRKLTCIFVDNGLLRKGERESAVKRFRNIYKINLKVVEAESSFLKKLKGVTDPEKKRKIIGKEFIRVFEKEAKKIGGIRFLAQGTLYPDLIESRSAFGGPSATIKTHHNVGGLPKRMNLKLIEPFKYLFKDEVRLVGKEIGLPDGLIWRQPFPGPGLAVRILGEVTGARLDLLREADWILIEEIKKALYYRKIWQAFCVLLPVKSVGVMGDERTYENVIAIRAVTSVDGMTADWARLPGDLLAKVSNRIINEVKGINRVVYDISSKPPATIEWE